MKKKEVAKPKQTSEQILASASETEQALRERWLFWKMTLIVSLKARAQLPMTYTELLMYQVYHKPGVTLMNDAHKIAWHDFRLEGDPETKEQKAEFLVNLLTMP